MSKYRFKDLIKLVAGEEYIWKEYVFTTYGTQIIQKLSSRPSVLFRKDFDKIAILPKIAVDEVVKKISGMTTSETTGEIGGEYIAFARNLIEEIKKSRVDSAEYFADEILQLCKILQENQVENLETTKETTCKIYRNFMMNQSSYADAEHEGAALADALNIHIILISVSDNGSVYQRDFGPDASEDVPTISLRFTQGDRAAHYVLDKVNEQLVPHSIYGDGDCLFASIAQGVLELYIQYSGDDTQATLAKRNISQLYNGVKWGLIPRDEFKRMLHHESDLFRQAMSNQLYEIDGELSDTELNILQDLMKYDIYQTVRIAASKALYIKTTIAQDRLMAKQTITELLTFPGLGMQHIDGYDLVRENAVDALSFLRATEKEGFIIDSNILSVLRDLMRHDEFQTVRIASAKALYLNGDPEDCVAADTVITGLINYNTMMDQESFGREIVRASAVKAIAILENPSEEVLGRLKGYLDESQTHPSVKRVALETLYEVGAMSSPVWRILIDKVTNAKYASNGQIKIALQLHPYACVHDTALHKLLLDHKNSYGENFILLVQKFLAFGTHEYPNRYSVTFLQALKYGINEYYGLQSTNGDESFAAKLFSLPGGITPTLELFDMLLKDFISKDPQGKWSTHEHNLRHYQYMSSKHTEVEKAIQSNSNNIYRSVINILMQAVVENLYGLLGVFRDHQKLQEIAFSPEEITFMKSLESDKTNPQHQSLFRGKGDDILHVKGSIKDSQKTSYMYLQMTIIQAMHNLKDYERERMQPGELSSYVMNNAKAREHAFEDPIEDFVGFLIELRKRLYTHEGKQQMLGIGFSGTFFDAPPIDSFIDEPTVHLSFTEQFRIVGSVFLWHMTLFGLRDHLSKEFDQRIHIRVDSYVDIDLKLMYNYAMSKMWNEVIYNSDSIDADLVSKLRSLVNIELNAKMKQNPNIQKSKEDLDHIEAYIRHCGGSLQLLKQINQKLNPPKAQKRKTTEVVHLDEDEAKILAKFGEYILNEKILVCVETQLIPILHSSLIFPVMLKPPNDRDPSVSFALDELRIDQFQNSFRFSVAKPCDKFCQPASTAYDLISEIQAQFAAIRGFVCSSIPKRKFSKAVIQFSEEELKIIEYAIQNKESYIDERYKVYEFYNHNTEFVGDCARLETSSDC